MQDVQCSQGSTSLPATQKKVGASGNKKSRLGFRGTKRGCSDHFISGAPSMNDEHPDFVPSIFFHSIEGSIGKLERYERKRKRGEEKTTVGSAMDVREDDGLDSLEAEEVFVPKERLDQLKLEYKRLSDDYKAVKRECEAVQAKNKKLKKHLNHSKFGFNSIKCSNTKICFFTGLQCSYGS
ncbi:hypothetical protein SKAU_G00207340 [Synaphobranchus kaupii]|uniref:Uncharacterized protein n=1 Tax=Synaphobranchus kaupii TaxID=118154 RepID=A0A9Q1F8F1_SYNKA|nr:hypothetical protein SKAU_G00207340 [Synaphobranchus kaupii]